MATLGNKKKFAANNKDVHEENPKKNQSLETNVVKNKEGCTTQVSE